MRMFALLKMLRDAMGEPCTLACTLDEDMHAVLIRIATVTRPAIQWQLAVPTLELAGSKLDDTLELRIEQLAVEVEHARIREARRQLASQGIAS